jgi:hypothetical protein
VAGRPGRGLSPVIGVDKEVREELDGVDPAAEEARLDRGDEQ